MDYRRFFRQAMMLTITTGLLASCSKDNNVGEPEADEQLVSISPGIALSAKANGDTDGSSSPAMDQVVEGLTFSFLRADDNVFGVGIFEFADNPEKISGTCAAPYMDEELQTLVAPIDFNPTQYYLVNGYKTRLWGWYPKTDYSAINRGQVLVTIPFDGKIDVLLANAESGSKTEPIKNFQFEHVLCQLQFQITAESEIAAQQWGSVTEIALENEYSQYMMIFSATETNPTTNFMNRTSLTAYLPETGIPIEYGESVEAGLIMVQPRTISTSNTINLKITTTGKGEMTEAIDLNDFINGHEFKAGYAYKLTLNFLQGEITIKLTPADWEAAEGPENVDLAENQPYVISDMNYIVSRNMFGDAEGWTVRPNDKESTWTAWDDSQRNPEKLSVPAILEIQEVNISDNTYENAITACNALGDGWRLPTITELELIHLYNNQLVTPLQGIYWSATAASAGESEISKAYTLDMESGVTDTAADATQPHHVRCVRDVEM